MWAHVDAVTAEGVYLQGSKLPLSQNLPKNAKFGHFPELPPLCLACCTDLLLMGVTPWESLSKMHAPTPQDHVERWYACGVMGHGSLKNLVEQTQYHPTKSSKHGIMGKLFENEELWTIEFFEFEPKITSSTPFPLEPYGWPLHAVRAHDAGSFTTCAWYGWKACQKCLPIDPKIMSKGVVCLELCPSQCGAPTSRSAACYTSCCSHVVITCLVCSGSPFQYLHLGLITTFFGFV